MNDTKIDVFAARDDPTRMFDESLVLLANVQSALVRALRAVDSGKLAATHELEPTFVELEVALKRAIEMERMVHDWKQKQRGTSKASTTADIDFDRARHEIGCRLARLRACCHTV